VDDRSSDHPNVRDRRYRLWSPNSNRLGWTAYLRGADPQAAVPSRHTTSLAYRPRGSASAPSIRCTMKTSSMHAAWKTRAWHAISRSLAALSTDSTLSHQLLEYHVHSSTASARLYEKRSQAEA
jgi:hypothetical protein